MSACQLSLFEHMYKYSSPKSTSIPCLDISGSTLDDNISGLTLDDNVKDRLISDGYLAISMCIHINGIFNHIAVWMLSCVPKDGMVSAFFFKL